MRYYDGAVKLLAFSLVSTALLWPGEILAKTPPAVGVVTTLKGQATVTRTVPLQQPRPLNFKDKVFVMDRISTKEQAIVRVLLRSKALVTIRELSNLTLTEEPGRSSSVDLLSGKVALAVARQRMRPGESIEVRTPNAVAAVRGTVLIVEVTPASTVRTDIHVLSGRVDVFDLAGVLQSTIAAGQSVMVTGTIFGQPRPSPPGIGQGLQPAPQHTDTPEDTKKAMSRKEQKKAVAHANDLAEEGIPSAALEEESLPPPERNVYLPTTGTTFPSSTSGSTSGGTSTPGDDPSED